MLNAIFSSVFTETTAAFTFGQFLACTAVSLILGLLIAAVYRYKSECTKSFAVTLALLPAVVCVVIMMVNGNVGTGVAVAGAFSLVRFRSAPGSAREIGAIFIAMGTGLMTGMGYLGYALVFVLILGGMTMLYTGIHLDHPLRNACWRTMYITIPENLNYPGVLDPVLKGFTSEFTLRQVATSHMGSLFKLTYDLTLKDPRQEKAFLDALRRRNGNLEISLCTQETVSTGL